MIFKVYGRRNDPFNELLSETTVEYIERIMGPDDQVEFYDMDDSRVEYLGPVEHPCYCPCVQALTDDGEELGYIENKYFYDLKNASADSAVSRIWWYYLERWTRDMRRLVD